MKQCLMIHEVDQWMFTLPLEDYHLTFDDGLYSQFVYFDQIRELNTTKSFFISTAIVAEPDCEQNSDFITCNDAHEHYFKTNDKSYYMNWEQIKEIDSDCSCEIGGHSHNHNRYNRTKIFKDTREMLEEFDRQSITIDSFCFPYNDEYVEYGALLQSKGIKLSYGKERLYVYDLQC